MHLLSPTLRFTVMVLLLFSAVFSFSSAQAESRNYGVFYPDMREPYRSVFESIITGIELQAELNSDTRIKRFALTKTTDQKNIDNWIIENKIDSLIALGRRSHHILNSVAQKIPVTTGAVLMSPDLKNNSTGIVLNPDPKIVFSQLLKLAPTVKRISVIYNPEKNSWLIEQAILAAKDFNLQCNSYPVTNLHQAAKQYRDLLAHQSGTENAVWLLNDNTVFDRNALFSLVLQEAWNRNFIVFSNNPAHVKRGVLFAMFPNNQKMGSSLFNLANTNTLNSNKQNRMKTLEDLLIAFNTRTAEHLQLNVSRQQRSKFDLVFPTR